MSDAAFVLASYGLVAGCLLLYAIALRRRVTAARRLAQDVARRSRAASVTTPAGLGGERPS